ncbi:MAG: TetR/AcrR family transcriptional regulator [Lachnospiraceae bacterium]|nr:TetR/AcrR family transcriptional regulator [Lachnospiraceae bacterium]
MNEKFFSLSKEKQDSIKNAGFRIYANASYAKGSVGNVAKEAGISKSLLFFYFKNKKEFYLFLIEQAIGITQKYLEEHDCYSGEDIFDMIQRGMQAKIRMMKEYPTVSEFLIHVSVETNQEVVSDIQEIIIRSGVTEVNNGLYRLNPEQYASGIDLNLMYKDMYYASEGYLQEQMRLGLIDIPKVEKEIDTMIRFWKSIYGRRA